MIPGMFLPYKIREKILKKMFREHTGRTVDFSSPEGFNEKLQWYKLYYYNPDSRRIIDKLGFKTYVSEKIGGGHTAELYGVWDDAAGIDLSGIPVPFVLKSNCSSYGENLKFIFERDQCDPERLRPELERWLDPMNTEMAGLCREYYEIEKPLIIAEEYLGEGQDPPADYKFYCFDGRPYCVYSASDHFSGGRPVHSAISFYDMDWKPLDVAYGDSRRKDLPMPKHFHEMKCAAETLSEGFPFVRVDFFDRENTYYLSEMTLSPGDGFRPFEPESFDDELGQLFSLPAPDTGRERFRSDVFKAYLRRALNVRTHHQRKRNNQHP